MKKMTNKEVILETDIQREKGYIYCCGTSKNGNINIIRVKSGRKKE
jgi:hypothetical protein